MPRMSKNGTDFFDVDDADDSIEAAKAKGYREYVPMTKNGKDVFDVEFSEDSRKAALAKGYQDVDAYNFTKDIGKPGKAESAFRSAIDGLSQGYGDEIGGAMEAGGAALGVRGLGSPDLRDIRLETDDEDKQDLGDTYRGMRDHRRSLNKSAEEANPKTYLAGQILGGVTTGVLAPGTNTLKGARALGAIQGLGRSEADLTKPSLDNVVQAAIDMGAGAAAGVAGYGAGKGVERVIQGGAAAVGKAGSAIKDGVEYLKSLGRGAKAGAKEAVEDLEIPGVKTIAAGIGAVKGAINEMKELGVAGKEFEGIASQAREILDSRVSEGLKVGKLTDIRNLQKITAVGNGKKLTDFSDDEAVTAALMSDGDNPIKQWFATKAATLYPGQIDADQYAKLLGTSSEARTIAREFDPKEAAKALKPTVEDVQGLFKGARDSRFQSLQEAAKGTFDSEGASAVLGNLDDAIADAGSLKSIPSSVGGVLDDVKGILAEGKGTKLQKLTAGAWDEVDPAERFHRLQKSRELLDQHMNWAKREGLGQAESLLRGVRGSIDDALKTSPEKVEADALYRASKELDAKFFGATEFRNAAGGIEIDEGKIARLLGNTDTANRFKASLQDLKEFAKRDDLPANFKEQAQALAAQLEEQIGKADLKRGIGEFRYKQGPSSPAIERLGSVAKGNTLLQDAVQSPSGFLGQADQMNKMMKGRLGKPFNDLEPNEKLAAAKFMLWMKNNPDASQQTADGVFRKLFGGGQ